MKKCVGGATLCVSNFQSQLTVSDSGCMVRSDVVASDADRRKVTDDARYDGDKEHQWSNLADMFQRMSEESTVRIKEMV